MKKRYHYIFWILLLPLCGFGQDYLFNTRYLSVDDGMLGRRINSIVQDKDGFIWIATNEGLNRYDGYEFRHFTKENDDLNSNDIESLAIDENGLLWIFYIKMVNYVFEPHVLNTQTFEKEILSDYLGTPKSETKKNYGFRGKIDNRIILGNNDKLYEYTSEKGVEPISAKRYLSPNKDFFWEIEDEYIVKLDTNSNELFRFAYPDFRLSSILSFSDSTIEIIGRQKGNRKAYLISQSLKSSDFTITPSRIVALGETNGLQLIGKTLKIPHENDYLKFDISEVGYKNVREMFQDRKKTIWIGTRDGIYLIDYKINPFGNYFEKNKKTYIGRGLWANQDYLYAYSKRGAFRWDFKNKTIKTLEPIFRSFQKEKLQTVATNTPNELWVGGTYDIGAIFQIDTLTGERIQSIPNPSCHIWSLFRDNAQKWYAGGSANGVYFYDSDTSTALYPYPLINGFSNLQKSKVVHFAADKHQTDYFWIAASTGWYLAHSDKGIIQQFYSKGASKHQIPSDNIYYTYQEKQNIYWVGTANSGLLRIVLTSDFQIEDVQQFTIKDGLSSNTIYAIFEDKKGFLWLSSNDGIIKFNKETYATQFFLEEDGLSHYEFNRTSSFQRRDGEIFFGTLNGIVSFHPEDLQNSAPYTLPLRITNCKRYLKKTDELIDVTQEVLKNNKIIIQPNVRLFNISVSLLDYFDTPKLKYAYKIKGFHKDFHTTFDNKITLSGLPYGKYELIVKGIGKDNRFSTEVLAIPIAVIRPFYLKWWFVLFVIVGFLMLVWQVLLWRTRRLKEREKTLESIVKERTIQLEHQTQKLKTDKAIIESQAEKLKSLDEMKSRFFANISHELRTPLTLILAPIQSQLKRNQLTVRDQTSALLIQQNANKLLKRINEILDLTKLEAKEMQLRQEATPFYDFTKRLAATFESFAEQKGLRLFFKYDLSKDLQILLDRDKFEHIFNNFLSNAIKFTPKDGEINIRLFEALSHNENQIILEIKDTGQGIPASDLKYIFDRFFQSKTNKNVKSQRANGGSGIGLALTKEIAELMKGDVQAESELGKGSVFYFKMPYVEALGATFPILEIINNEPVQILNKLSNSEIDTKKSTILLVEDNRQLRDYISLILKEKYNIITAENGKIALEWLAIPSSETPVQSLPSAVISDIMMPEMDGFELLKQLKSSDKWRHIPVIMLTARTNIKAKLKALRIGVDDYLLKPFDEEELLARIKNLIENAQNRQDFGKNDRDNKSQITEQKTPIVTASDSVWLKEIENMLNQEIGNSQFNIESLATAFQLSRRQIHRRIKTITGLTPNQYFRTIKLQAAREILETGKFNTVNEVAYAVGFDTPKYFSKLYEERFGKRPSTYFKA